MDWLEFMEMKRTELVNTGHVMDDETFNTHLLNSLPQAEYEGTILTIKEKLRRRSIHEVCQGLGGRGRRLCIVCLPCQKEKGTKYSLKDDVDIVESFDISQ